MFQALVAVLLEERGALERARSADEARALAERYHEQSGARSAGNGSLMRTAPIGIRYRGERGLEPVHTLNGTAVVDRMALAILENFGGEVPAALRPYGAPERVER